MIIDFGRAHKLNLFIPIERLIVWMTDTARFENQENSGDDSSHEEHDEEAVPLIVRRDQL